MHLIDTKLGTIFISTLCASGCFFPSLNNALVNHHFLSP
jgi:hypothetical protein